MTIEEIAQEKIVEGIVVNISKGHSENPINLEDLIQDIYLTLCEKSATLENLTDKEVKYYIARIAANNIKSKTSPYYYRYKKNKHLPLEAWAQDEENNPNDNDV